MEQFQQKNMTVTLKICQIKPSKLATTLEVVLCNYTSIERSDIIFEPNPETLGTTLLEIANLPTMKEYNRVTVRAQVIKLADPEKVGKGLTKREATIADKTEATTCILTLWGKDVNWLTRTNSIEWLSEHTEENTNFPSPNVEPVSPPSKIWKMSLTTLSTWIMILH